MTYNSVIFEGFVVSTVGQRLLSSPNFKRSAKAGGEWWGGGGGCAGAKTIQEIFLRKTTALGSPLTVREAERPMNCLSYFSLPPLSPHGGATVGRWHGAGAGGPPCQIVNVSSLK